MSSGDRDKQFDEVLERHVRRSQRDIAGAEPRENCPDAEILAAYHERSLSPEEMAQWKEHIAACANCQEVLTQLEATDAILIPEDNFQNERDAVLVGALAAAPVAAPMAFPAGNRKVASIDTKPPRKIIRWMAPAGAIAAGLLIWVVVRENRLANPPVNAPVEIAENRRDAVEALQRQRASNQILNQDESGVGKEASSPALSKDKKEPRVALDGLSKARTSMAGSEYPKLATREKSRVESFDAAPSAPVRDEKKRLPAEVAAPALNSPAAAPPPPAVQANAAPQSPQASRSAIGAIAGKKKSEKTATAEQAVGRAAMYAAAAPSRDAAGGATLQKTTSRSAPLVASPGSVEMWRLGAAGVIEFSQDAGSTWKLQQSFVTTNLTAGSAPLNKVCWIVGTHGTILVTVDAGVNWKKVSSPIAENLGGIHATDGLHATVWDGPRQNTYETMDGGLTWKQIANE